MGKVVRPGAPLKSGVDSWDALMRDLSALMDDQFMKIIVALLVLVLVLWLLFEVYDWAKAPKVLRKERRDRPDSGDGVGKRSMLEERGTHDGVGRSPGTTRSRLTERRGEDPWPRQSNGSGSSPFGGATGETGSVFKKDKVGPAASSGNDLRSPWERSERKGGVPDPTPEEPEAELPRFRVASGDVVPPPRAAAPDHGRLLLEAWRDAWASDVVSVRSLVDRMGQLSGVRGVNVLPESSVVVVRFEGVFLAVPSQQDYELCENLFDADRPPGRFATVIDIERAAVVSGTSGEVLQRGMLRIECG